MEMYVLMTFNKLQPDFVISTINITELYTSSCPAVLRERSFNTGRGGGFGRV